VLDYLAKNTDNPTLRKIQNFEQLTSNDFLELQRILWVEVGSKEEYDNITNGKKYSMNVAAFIRVINGINHQKALEKYAEFIKGAQLNAQQEQYLKNILDYISINGDIQLKDFGDFPLKNYSWREVFGNQFVMLKDFVSQVHKVISA